ncbi:ABC transporter substrate-binding protein [Streptomyces hoynatensis]|uniref:Sugar ABC transporter substrate-binding protein n=1 Tax=Streptomyces hoynatensis TaxID=1141874 RepID=A0A3A9YZP8_9ACTN|nr:sugar ABC transporter substrate-binding protein [Streptomyces hoynatensis]RKN41662.1 sugar ABC transporter substrate-binding protein [Streptomyces hoynatensis]
MFTRTVAALVGLAASLLLASCGLSDDANGNQPTTITYWSWVSGSREMVDRFNATHDDIRVNFELIPSGTSGGYSKMFNAVRAGRAPDIVTVEYPELPGFVTQNVVQPITRYGVEELAGRYPEWTWRQVALGGEVYALPKDIAPQVLFYRADLFEEYGLEPPATWEEYRAEAERLHEEHPDVSMTTFPTADAGLLAGLAWQAGADWFDTSSGQWRVDTTDEATRRVADYWDSLLADGLVTAGPTFAEQHITDLEAGRSLTLIAAPWTAANLSRFVPDLAGTWGVAPLPAWDLAASGNYGGSTMALPVGSPHPEEAMEFARWVSTSPDAIAAAAPVSTAFPANADLADDWRTAVEEANPYTHGMNLAAVAAAAAPTIPPSWEWGPDMTDGFSRLNDETTLDIGLPGGLATAFRDWQDATVDQLRRRGYDVTG